MITGDFEVSQHLVMLSLDFNSNYPWLIFIKTLKPKSQSKMSCRVKLRTHSFYPFRPVYHTNYMVLKSQNPFKEAVSVFSVSKKSSRSVSNGITKQD